MTKPTNTYASSVVESVEALTVLIELSGTDITADYGDWCNIGFALAHEFGADGEPFFHRISAFYPNYDPKIAQKQYAACLRHRVPSGKAPITIATLFHIAKSHGINLPCPPSKGMAAGRGIPLRTLQDGSETAFSSKKVFEESEESEENAPEIQLPTFSQNIRNDLPSIMQRIVADSTSDVDADILVLGSLTVFSACIPNVFGVYDRRQVFANLFLFVTARASAGKGRLSLCRHLAAPLHQALREKYKKQMKKYEELQSAYAANRKNSLNVPPKEPPFLTLFVPANSTATVVYQTLAQNNGVGLLFETEGDTLANAFNSDLGNYSDGFRKAFHHETISYLRKKDREYVEILKPKFSAILSGTPEQVFNLIPSAENGFFSRFIFYVMPTEIVWHDMFDDSDGPTADELFEEIGRDFYSFHKLLTAQTVRFTLQPEQKQRFNAFFSQTQQEYAAIFGNDIIASVRRLGLILFRFAMILTVLRQMDDGTFPPPSGSDDGQRPEAVLTCADADFATALAMVKVLLQHTVTVFQALPRRAERRFRQDRRQRTESHMQTFLAALPESFDRPTYLKTASDIGINEKTAERYITDLCRSGQLDHPASGQYAKPSNT